MMTNTSVRGFLHKAKSVGDRLLQCAACIKVDGSLQSFINNKVAKVRLNSGEHDEALKLFQESLAIQKRVFGGDSKEVAVSLTNLGNVHQERGEYDEALKLYQESLAIDKRVFGGDKEVAESLTNIRNVHQE
jgi:tetratricopeptide (TPR) repeat protein